MAAFTSDILKTVEPKAEVSSFLKMDPTMKATLTGIMLKPTKELSAQTCSPTLEASGTTLSMGRLIRKAVITNLSVGTAAESAKEEH